MNYEDYLFHHGVKGMKWGVRKERLSGGFRNARQKSIEKAYALGAKVNPREHTYAIKRAINKTSSTDKYLADATERITKSTGILTTNSRALKAIDKAGIDKHKSTVYNNLDSTDIKRLKKYTDAAVYSRAVNGYLAIGEPKDIAARAEALKKTIQKNTISDTTVYRSCNIMFSTKGLASKLDSMGEDEFNKTISKMDTNFKGKRANENRIYSTSTSPTFAIDTWRKVNPTAAKTYNTYLVINTKGTPGIFADGRTSEGKTLVNTRSNQEVILAPNKMKYTGVKWDAERKMYAISMDAE